MTESTQAPMPVARPPARPIVNGEKSGHADRSISSCPRLTMVLHSGSKHPSIANTPTNDFCVTSIFVSTMLTEAGPKYRPVGMSRSFKIQAYVDLHNSDQQGVLERCLESMFYL